MSAERQGNTGKFKGAIEWVARLRAQGTTLKTLEASGEQEAAQNLFLIIEILEENNLMGIVGQRTAEIIKLEEMRRMEGESKKRKGIKSTPQGQLHLEQAHPEGYKGMWKLSQRIEPYRPIAHDPEKRIRDMHYRKRLAEIHEKDLNREWREYLKSVGYTDSLRQGAAEFNMGETIFLLIEGGVWDLVMDKSPSQLTRAERVLIYAATHTRSGYEDI